MLPVTFTILQLNRLKQKCYHKILISVFPNFLIKKCFPYIEPSKRLNVVIAEVPALEGMLRSGEMGSEVKLVPS